MTFSTRLGARRFKNELAMLAPALALVVMLSCFCECNGKRKENRHTNAPIRIDLFMMDYFLVYLGVPGTRVTVRIDSNLDCIKLLPSTSQNSMSFMASAPLTNYSVVAAGSEVFKFRTSRVRLPVVYTGFDVVDNMYLPDVRYVGILGLGSGSPLWRMWDGYVITPTALYLGSSAYTNAAEWKNGARYIPLGVPMRARRSGVADGVVYQLLVDRQTEITRCPRHLYGARNATMEVVHKEGGQEGEERVLFSFRMTRKEHVVVDGMGNTRSVILPNKDTAEAPNSTAILLGKWSLRNFIVHYDMRALKWTLYPSRNVFGNDVNSRSAEIFCLIAAFSIGALATQWWLFTTRYNACTVTGMHIILCVKLYACLWCVVTLLFHAHGYQGHRFLSHYMMSDVSSLYSAFTALLATMLAFDAAIACWSMLVLYTHDFGKECVQWETVVFINKIIFEPVAIVVVWLCLLTDQSNISALVKELGISLFLLLLSAFNALNSFMLSNLVVSLVSVATAVLCYLFFVFVNVEHVFREYWGAEQVYPSWFVKLVATFLGLGFAVWAFTGHSKVMLKGRINTAHMDYKDLKSVWKKKKE